MSHFGIHMPSAHCGQTSPSWGAGSIIRINIERKQPVDGDHLIYDESDNIWKIKKPTFQLHIDPKSPTSTPKPIVVYDPSTQYLLYTTLHYATLLSTNEQKIPESKVYAYTYTSMPTSNGIVFNVAQPSKIFFTQVGVYKVGTSILSRQTNSSGDTVYFGFRLNNQPIEHSGSDVYIHSSHASTVTYFEMILPITSITDYIEVIGFTTSNRVFSPYIPSPSIGMPDCPSIITTVQQCL